MNILIPSIGRKFNLAQMFVAVLSESGGKLVCADSNPLASGLYGGHEKAILPPTQSPDFWPTLDQVLVKHKIDAIIPVRDGELSLFAARKESGLLAPTVVTSPSKTLDLCRDKILLSETLARGGVKAPQSLVGVELNPPYVIKPRSGSGGKGVRVVADSKELPGEGEFAQEFVQGLEYTVDAYVAKGGGLVTSVARQRVSVVNGQSDIGRTVHDAELAAITQRVCRLVEFRGPINIQFIRNENGAYLIEINPRFSGGIAITKAAGIDFAKLCVMELAGEKVPENPAYEDITWCGFSSGLRIS